MTTFLNNVEKLYNDDRAELYITAPSRSPSAVLQKNMLALQTKRQEALKALEERQQKAQEAIEKVKSDVGGAWSSFFSRGGSEGSGSSSDGGGKDDPRRAEVEVPVSQR